MENIAISVPSSLYFAIYKRFGEGSSEAILGSLSKLVDSDTHPSGANCPYPRPSSGTITGKVWEIADALSSNELRASRQQVVAKCLAEGINMNTANTQYSHWSKAPIQGGGMLRVWQSPDRKFKHTFLTLDLDCKPDNYPGIVIISDKSHRVVSVTEVKNLERELPSLMAKFESQPEVYWDLETNAQRRKEILSSLTSDPVFVG
jgi:hypothetical protein